MLRLSVSLNQNHRRRHRILVMQVFNRGGKVPLVLV